jgi:glycosyltransferase involved in cell wall biosynthesis
VSDAFFVVPDGIDDPARPSGGNTYDRQLISELGAGDWTVHERPVEGFWDAPDASSFVALGAALREIPDGAAVLLDGLIASTAPEVLVPQAERLHLIVLVHMPLGDRPADDAARAREHAVLSAAAAVVTTSAWCRRRLLDLYDLPAERAVVAEPGVDEPGVEPAAIGPGARSSDAKNGGPGGALLCVGAVSLAKGHDILLDAFDSISALDWHCTCVGSLDRDAVFADDLRRQAAEAGLGERASFPGVDAGADLDGRDTSLGERVSFPGVRTGADLDRAYMSADVLVHASRAETYGLVITEALARGLPVIATDVGGVAEALAEAPDGSRPGLLVPPEDQPALARALSAWLTDADLRARLRRAASDRRATLSRWSTTASIVADVLSVAEARPIGGASIAGARREARR